MPKETDPDKQVSPDFHLQKLQKENRGYLPLAIGVFYLQSHPVRRLTFLRG
jgi:hypothetical protein